MLATLVCQICPAARAHLLFIFISEGETRAWRCLFTGNPLHLCNLPGTTFLAGPAMRTKGGWSSGVLGSHGSIAPHRFRLAALEGCAPPMRNNPSAGLLLLLERLHMSQDSLGIGIADAIGGLHHDLALLVFQPLSDCLDRC